MSDIVFSRLVFLLLLAVVAPAAVALLLLPGKGSRSAPPPDNSIYVWQQEWTRDVAGAVEKAAERTAAFLVFAARVERDSDRPRVVFHAVDWECLAKAGRPVIAVVRAADGLAGFLEKDILTGTLAGAFGRLRSEAAARKVELAGVQFDFDCPVSRLSRYAILAGKLRRELGGVPLSITALPSWLGHGSFRRLVHETSFYVLQVHGIERPSTLADEVRLCHYDRIPGYVARAEAVGHPYRLALPTYSYRLVYTEAGRFVRFSAEERAAPFMEGFLERVESPDAGRIAGLVRELSAKPPEHFRGISWFRLPVSSDRYNWPWATLVSVMDGVAPASEVGATVRTPEAGLQEIWVENRGKHRLAARVLIRYEPASAVLARDLLGGFREEAPGVLNGPAPRPDSGLMAGWFRLAPGPTSSTLTIREVVYR